MAELPREQGKNWKTLTLVLLLSWERYKGIKVLTKQLGVLTQRWLGVVLGHSLILTPASAGAAAADPFFQGLLQI